MKGSTRITAIAIVLATAMPLAAELQNVEVRGTVRIRGNYFDYDKVGGVTVNGNAFVEQRTRLNVKADFTNGVSTLVEFDYYNNWGEDFRSVYLTGADFRGGDGNDVDLHQGYIDARQLWGTPLSARIGRQEFTFGSGWLVGVNDTAPYYTGLSFDALLLTYTTEDVFVGALAGKLLERSPIDKDGDVDLYGLYSSYTGIENIGLDAYWLFIRDAANFDGALGAHVFGLRGAGTIGTFDFEAEAAYQYSNWDEKRRFRRNKDHSSGAIGGNLLLGYTFEVGWSPRAYAGAAYFSGADEDLAFNRLFSDWKYSLILDTQANLSNLWLVHGGVSVNPTESVQVTASVGYIEALENRDLRRLLWWGSKSDKPLGVETGLRVDYAYTEDLKFSLGYAHLFALNGLRDGNYVPNNGSALAFSDDANYIYAETQVKF